MRKIWFFIVLLASSAPAVALTPFTLPWVNHPFPGTSYSSADHPNSIFVIEFLANFCSSCNANATKVNELATVYLNDSRVQVLDMSIDRNDREIAAWIRNHQPNHPVLKDIDRLIWNQVGEQYIPTVVMIDCQGQERFRHTGEWDEQTILQIRALIDDLLANQCKL